jgi:hypothetical protein
MTHYSFSTDWFQRTCADNWKQRLPTLRPKRILEIGSYEGASTCFLIDQVARERDVELHCVDTWAGGIELRPDRLKIGG